MKYLAAKTPVSINRLRLEIPEAPLSFAAIGLPSVSRFSTLCALNFHGVFPLTNPFPPHLAYPKLHKVGIT